MAGIEGKKSYEESVPPLTIPSDDDKIQKSKTEKKEVTAANFPGHSVNPIKGAVLSAFQKIREIFQKAPRASDSKTAFSIKPINLEIYDEEAKTNKASDKQTVTTFFSHLFGKKPVEEIGKKVEELRSEVDQIHIKLATLNSSKDAYEKQLKPEEEVDLTPKDANEELNDELEKLEEEINSGQAEVKSKISKIKKEMAAVVKDIKSRIDKLDAEVDALTDLHIKKYEKDQIAKIRASLFGEK